MFILYDIIFILFAIFILPGYIFRRKFHPGFLMRLGIYPVQIKRRLATGENIWLHAVSVGEVQACRKLLAGLHKEYPGRQIVISTVTPTGHSLAKRIAGDKDVIIYLPLDISFIVRSVIARINPSLVIIAETELWPNLISALVERKTPIISVNARISEGSFRGYRLARFLVGPLLNKISIFCLQGEADLLRLAALGTEQGRLKVTGNMKFDNAEAAAGRKDAEDAEYRKRLGLEVKERLLVAGSTHPGEEEIILRVYSELLKDFPDLRLLIAPRHPERAQGISKLVIACGFKSLFISRLGPGTVDRGPGTVFILDTIGELTYFYAVSEIVFMGKSLVNKGGQNILEPASFAKPVLFGPHMFNFREIARLYLENQAALMVRDEKELLEKVRFLLENPDEAKRLGLRARELLSRNQGATQRNLEAILSLGSSGSLGSSESLGGLGSLRSFLLGIAQDKRKDLSAFLLRPFLYLLSLIYGIIVRLACWGYRAGVFPGYKSKIKVISVGNITLGGTGKTPFVEFLSGYLSGQGRQVAVLSRGYNQDEPKSLVKNLAGVIVLTGRDRIRTARQAEGLKAEVIILDDGFQHWRLKRDLDIVMVNSRVFLGNRCLVPRGILREPPGSLRRADIIVLSKADKAGDISGQRRILKRINPNALIIESLHRPVCFYGRSGNTLALEYIRGRDVCLLSGIADPGSFKEIIVALGARIALNFEFPDHHPYRGQDIRGVSDGCRQHRVRTIVTTEKDLMRLPLECLDKEIELLVLKIELRIIANEEGFFNRILSLLAG